LRNLGLEVQTGVGGTGVVAILEGSNDGATVLVRSDMDALPVTEENDVPYLSTIEGKMHACGHDGHMSVVLGTAEILQAHRDQLAGRVKFVFQPAEEIGQGALTMVGDGVLNDPKPDYSIGLHLWNELPLGAVGLDSGTVMAAVSNFDVEVMGVGGHGGIPQETVDPVVCASQIVTALQTIVSRNVSPLDTVVISVTWVKAGSAHNVIPSRASLHGTLRTFTIETRDNVVARMHTLCENIATAFGCTARVNVEHHTKPIVNDDALVARTRQAFDTLNITNMHYQTMRTMAGEDFSEFTQDIPGLFFFVGSANAERGLNYPHHHERFDFDEAALPTAVALLSAAVVDLLKDGQDG
jgi:amidohydrolase